MLLLYVYRLLHRHNDRSLAQMNTHFWIIGKETDNTKSKKIATINLMILPLSKPSEKVKKSLLLSISSKIYTRNGRLNQNKENISRNRGFNNLMNLLRRCLTPTKILGLLLKELLTFEGNMSKWSICHPSNKLSETLISILNFFYLNKNYYQSNFSASMISKMLTKWKILHCKSEELRKFCFPILILKRSAPFSL